jgi:hypothetical protein
MRKEKAECSICGAIFFGADPACLMIHVLTSHPMELLTHKDIGPRVTGGAFDLGRSIAEKLFGKKGVR